ncbi:hypothetical protein U729_3192 (plasmid) [Clostridium baratii str. Sullivan]|uniref:Uncharacterized protein n=1 Tax=Clostridium baratii str. Sullivan TaxID=1415775 RepID=A0A0A7G304_9CLOT|nr:hypothetical protein [Clostridium baratii]AIY85395.1 hypothetical protein U729_3192 [Clostridium baratii str. Sullivan]
MEKAKSDMNNYLKISLNKKLGNIDVEISCNDNSVDKLISFANKIISKAEDNIITKDDKKAKNLPYEIIPTKSDTEEICVTDSNDGIPKTSDDEILARYDSSNSKVIEEEEDDTPKYGESVVFACPDCGQWCSVKVEDNFIIRDYDEREPNLHLLISTANFKNNKDISKISPIELSQLILSEYIKYEASPEREGYCINCGNTNTMDKWNDKYSDIVNKNICPVCSNDNGDIKNINEKVKCDKCSTEYYIAK